MIDRTFLWLANGAGYRRRWLFRQLYERIARRSQNMVHWTHMNYGYAAIESSGQTLALKPNDEPERYCHQLYDQVVSNVNLKGKDILEVSCGRGGGASFLCRYKRPQTIIGVDIADKAVEFCRKVHRLKNLRFIQGDAEDLPVFDCSFDAVINVEASFCYGEFDRFLAEVERTLRPGGYFLFADLRLAEEVDDLISSLAKTGLEICDSEDITANVLKALALDSARREREIKLNVPWFAQGATRTFGGTRGSRIPTFLADGRMRYLRFVLGKPVLREIQGRTR